MMRRFGLACLVLLGATTLVQANMGNPQVKSIEAISFGPNGLLLIGDSKGAQVVAVETGDQSEMPWADTAIANVDQLLASKLGLMSKDIQILKLAVNPTSHKAYVAVRSLKSKQDVLLTVDGTGKVAEFALDNVKYQRYPLAVGDKAVTKITDITWAGNRIVAATQASDVFASRVFSITPGTKDAGYVNFSTETYHVGHGQWETKAPILCIMPYEENGKSSVIGSFTCTPIVKYSVDDIQPNAKVKGISVLELGTGNQPRSMFSYEKGGKKYVLVNTMRMAGQNKSNPVGPSPYWVARVDFNLLGETININEKALWRVDRKGKASESKTDRASVANGFFGVTHMAKLDGDRALVIRTDGKEGIELRALQLP